MGGCGCEVSGPRAGAPVAVLNLSDLDRWAGLLDSAADEVCAARCRLEAAAAAVHWSSAAREQFEVEVQEHLHRLGRSASQLDEAAEALRRHRVGAEQAQDALGEALGPVLDATRGVAGQGVAVAVAVAVVVALAGQHRPEQRHHRAVRLAARESRRRPRPRQLRHSGSFAARRRPVRRRLGLVRSGLPGPGQQRGRASVRAHQHLPSAVVLRRCVRLLPIVVLVVAATGCQAADGPSGRPSSPSNAQNTAEMARVVERARALDTVIDVKGVYDSSLTTYGQTDLIATVPAGTPAARTDELADELIALIWRSRIDPITSMGASVVPPGGDPSRGSLAGRSISSGGGGFTRLAEELGPRPPD